jgi:CBS domain-containing protein
MKAIYSDANDPLDGGVNAARRRVSAVMSSPVTCIDGSVTLSFALQTMVAASLRHLAVLDDQGHFLGILADRAIAAAWATDPSCLSWTPAATVLETRPATVSPGSHILDAARAMRQVETDAVAVIDAGGAVVGIVTGSDMVAQLAR